MSDFEKNVDRISVSMYSGKADGTSNGGDMMASREIIAAALKATGKSQSEGARMIGHDPQWLSARIVRSSLRADDFLALMDQLGIDVAFTVRDTGKPIKELIKGAGRRVRKMVNRVIYDTAASNALANSFYADGVNEYTDGWAIELYVDSEGRYFFAKYSENGDGDHITPALAEEAATFISRYGTEIHKAPHE